MGNPGLSLAESLPPSAALRGLQTTLEASGDQLLLVVGDLVVTGRCELQRAVDDALDQLRDRRLVVDLTGVGVIDSTGLGELIGCLSHCDHEDAA